MKSSKLRVYGVKYIDHTSLSVKTVSLWEFTVNNVELMWDVKHYVSISYIEIFNIADTDVMFNIPNSFIKKTFGKDI